MALTRLLVVEHEADAGLGRLAPVLRQAARLDVHRPYLGDRLPDGLSGHQGLIVLGGAMSAWDDEVAPWLPATRGLLAGAVGAGLPTLGICLGAQLLAVATGGRVERGDRGLEVGLVPVTALPAATDDALLGTAAGDDESIPVEVAQYHQDAITELPPDATLLATGERYPHQAFRVGKSGWGVQYHPEVTAADFAAWLRDGHGAVRAAGLDAAEIARRYAAAEPGLAAVARAHAGAFAALLGRST